MPVPEQGQRYLCPGFAADQVAHLCGGHSADIRAVHGSDNVPGQKSGCLSRATLCDLEHIHAETVCIGGNRDANAHVGILYGFQVGLVVFRGKVVAPAVAQGADHGTGGGVLNRGLVRFADKPL